MIFYYNDHTLTELLFLTTATALMRLEPTMIIQPLLRQSSSHDKIRPTLSFADYLRTELHKLLGALPTSPIDNLILLTTPTLLPPLQSLPLLE
jgi:hypothetical protein